MQPELIVVLGLVSIGTMVLIGMRMRFIHKMQGRKTEELEQVVDTLDALLENTRQLREEFSDLQERLDFQERLLGEPRGERVDTPV